MFEAMRSRRTLQCRSSWRVFAEAPVTVDTDRWAPRRDREIASMASRVEATVASAVSDLESLAEIRQFAREENRAAARKILWCARLWENWIERDVRLGSGDVIDCGNGALAEMSAQLGCSRTVAQSYAEIGMDLRLRLSRTRALFEKGISTSRASAPSAGRPRPSRRPPSPPSKPGSPPPHGTSPPAPSPPRSLDSSRSRHPTRRRQHGPKPSGSAAP